MNTFSISQSELIHCLVPPPFLAVHHGRPAQTPQFAVDFSAPEQATESEIHPASLNHSVVNSLPQQIQMILFGKIHPYLRLFPIRKNSIHVLSQSFPFARHILSRSFPRIFNRRSFKQTFRSKQFESSVEKHPP